MSKKYLLFLAVIAASILPLYPSYADPPYQYVKVEGRQLVTDFDKDGVYDPYVIKGVGYQPYSVGRFPDDWGTNIYDNTDILGRDLPLLQSMNVNTIRIWKGDNTEFEGRFQTKITTRTLDLADSHGIKVIAGFWIETWGPWCNVDHIEYNPPVFLNDHLGQAFIDARVDIINRFRDYVNQFKDHPAILFWAIGNENNYSIPPNADPNYLANWYSLINQMAYEAHMAEGVATFHPVAIVNGGLDYIGDGVAGANDNQMSSLDIWGANVYTGSSFGNLFDDYAARSAKPLWISEYGLDAWNTTGYRILDGWQDGNEGSEWQSTQAQWDGMLWDEIVQNKDIAIGATAMEYSDEWWKPYSHIGEPAGWFYNSSQEHFGFGPTDTSCPRDGIFDWYPPTPDQFLNEEWFGIMSIADNPNPLLPDILTPRQVYTSLQNRFACSESSPYFAGPDNNKSCDGTFACCSSPDNKSRNGSCVSTCGGGTCFVSGTPILMANGKTKPIEKIRVGDVILAYDMDAKKTVKDKVKKTFIHDADNYLVVNDELNLTDNHPVFSNGKWVEIGSLKVGDKILNKKGEYQEIKTIKQVKADVKVYNFEVNPYHTYIANGYVVHNRKMLFYTIYESGDGNE